MRALCLAHSRRRVYAQRAVMAKTAPRGKALPVPQHPQKRAGKNDHLADWPHRIYEVNVAVESAADMGW